MAWVKLARRLVQVLSAGVLVVCTAAGAQLYPKQNLNGPVPPYRNDAFPYPGQCTSNPANSFVGAPPACPATIPAAPAVATGTVKPLNPATQPKWQWQVPNPVDFTPDQVTYPGVDYYEISVAPATNMQAAGTLGVFPDPTRAPGAGQTAGAWVPDAGGVPQGSQWTGLVDPATKKPLYTKVWGYGQINMAGGPLAALAGVPGNNATPVVVSWPAMNLRGTKGRPMIVKFVNQLPDTHVFCPYPLAWDWPCAIDRTLMGTRARTDPTRSLVMASTVPATAVNQFGSPQQPDNAVTIHFHGGEIPPQSDGFSEKWFGNANSGAAYSPAPVFIDPDFQSPYGTVKEMKRPGGTNPFEGYDRMTYYYPMVNDESTVWYHDHALGKTRANVVAGPAGFAPVEDPTQQVAGGAYAWLNPLRATQTVSGVKIPMYDLFLAIQDRAFNTDGSINFPNGLGQPVPVPPPAVGMTPVTIGNNPQVHPQWVGEYFADHITVNGVIWPRVNVARGVYRIRLLDGSNARCYQLGLGTTEPKYATPQASGSVNRNVGFTVIADEQGYLQKPAVIPANGFLQMCPGERYEILVDFSLFPAGTSIWMSNTANAPFPAGISPQARGSIFAHTASIIRFDVTATAGVALTPPANANPLFVDMKALPYCGAMPAGQVAVPGTNCYSARRQLYLNERIDPVTLTSLGLQINGVPFEYTVTETPKRGTIEVWDIINTTGDFHPMHLHLVKFQIVQRQTFQQAQYMATLCGSNTCQIMGGGAAGQMQVVPDVTPFLQTGGGSITPPAPEEFGWKDTAQAPPGVVTTLIARWDGKWTGGDGTCPAANAGKMNFPGVENYDPTALYNPALPLCFEPVFAQPYQWHCHITDHEDAEMMRTSLVIP